MQIIDVAPSDIDQVRKLRRSLELAVLTDDFAQARVILDVLRSEIRVRTLYVPLATYPAAMAQAAGLVERGNMAAAAEALDRARNTLAMTDVVSRAASLLYWMIVALIGASLGILGFAYTGASIASTFLITAGAFGGLSLWGYTTCKDLTGFGSFLSVSCWLRW